MNGFPSTCSLCVLNEAIESQIVIIARQIGAVKTHETVFELVKWVIARKRFNREDVQGGARDFLIRERVHGASSSMVEPRPTLTNTDVSFIAFNTSPSINLSVSFVAGNATTT